MDHFPARNGELFAEEIPLSQLAAEVGTPAYIYSAATLRRHARLMLQALAPLGDVRVCFAVKANSNLAVLALLAAEGLGADVVSEGELRKARRAGIPAQKIVFSGVGKTDDELQLALAEGIYQLNVESEGELLRLSHLAAARGVTAPVSFRVNPDIDARTNAKISTGKAENKFGIAYDRIEALYRRAETLQGIRPLGLAMHIGSQLRDLQPLSEAAARLGALVQRLRRQGLAVSRVDFGGGLGVPYDPALPPPPDPVAYAATIRQAVAGWPDSTGLSFLFEPGRLIAGNAGLLLTRVIAVKEGATRRFVVLDAAMNDLMRPALYDAYHHIRPVQAGSGPDRPATIVGPVCETGDQFAEDRPFPPVSEGDLVAIMTAGAYGATMSGTYNSRLLVPEVLVDGNRFAVVRPRQTMAELLGQDRLPPWFEAEGETR